MKRLVLIMTMALLGLVSYAQKPKWVVNPPKAENDTYRYVVARGFGRSFSEAYENAIQDLHRQVLEGAGQDMIVTEKVGETYYCVVEGQRYHIRMERVCVWPEDISSFNQEVCFLYQVATQKGGRENSVFFSDFNECHEIEQSPSDILYLNGAQIYKNGKALRYSEINQLFANSESQILYNEGMQLYENGVESPYLFPLITGVSIDFIWFVVGVNASNTQSPDGFVAYYDKSKWVLYGGAVLAVSGIVLPYIKYAIKHSIGKTKIRKAVNRYNNERSYSQNGIEMEYGLTYNGVHLCISF